MSASSDLSPEFSFGSMEDDSSPLSRSRIGSCTVSDADDSDGFSFCLNQSFSSWNLMKGTPSTYTDSSDDLAHLCNDAFYSENFRSSLFKKVNYF